MEQSPSEGDLIVGTIKAPGAIEWIKRGGLVACLALYILLNDRDARADNKALSDKYDAHQATMLQAVQAREEFEREAGQMIRTEILLLRQLCVNSAKSENQRDGCLQVK